MADDHSNLSSESFFGNVSSRIAEGLARSFSRVDWGRFLAQVAPEFVLPPIEVSGITQQMRANLLLMARGGWYPHNEMSISLIRNAAEEIEQGKYQEADNRMAAFFEANYQNIKSGLLAELPERSQVLTSTFQAHEHGQFALSVPVFLIQADGVCFDVAKVQLYSKRDKKPKIADIVNGMDAGTFTAAILSPLATNAPLTAGPVERMNSDYPAGALNRHQVLHGESSDYGTRVNGLKAVSLLNYVCNMRQRLSIRNAA